MRTNTDFFNEFNVAAQKELRLVIVIDFPTPLVLTSHAGIPNIPSGQIDDVIRDVSSVSQRLVPDEGRSEIGSLSFSVIDKASAITDRFRSEQAAGVGLKGRKVELYRGGSNIAGGADTDWSEFRVEQTVQIESAVEYEKGAYKISCSDIQREMRRDIFDLAKTRLAANFDAGAATLDVFSTDGFDPCDHVASFGDEPIGSFIYVKIKYQNGFEIVRATGKTGSSFTGCVRGLFGTDDVNHVLTAQTGPTTGIEIEEYIYLELPAAAMAAALLTGQIPGGGELPARWNLGIPPALLNQSAFNNIGTDWFVTRAGINGGFDTGDLTGWQAAMSGTVVNAGVDARSGVYVMEVPAGAGGPNQFADELPIVAGETLHVRGFAKSRNTPTSNGNIQVRFYDSIHAQIGGPLSIGFAVPADTTFKKISGSVVAPALSVTCAVDLGETTGTGEYWYDDVSWHVEADYTKGLIFRFQAIKKTDGKRFIEREVCLLAGAFLLIGADGRISMRRMTGVISSADFVQELTPDNAIAIGSLKHDLSRVRNQFDIEWAWLEFPGEQKPRFVRRDILIDATSIALHGDAKPLPLQFKALHNDRHTFTTLINRFDALRDRYAGPPLRLTIDLLPRLNDLEVGDIVRVVLPNVRDFTATDTLDRSFEIQRISINQRTGRVTCELFGSSMKADPIVDDDAGASAELPDGWYDSEGTDANTPLSIDGSGFLLADGTLTGGSDTREIFYVLGNFTIPSARTLTITGNVELRVRGLYQINGEVNAAGGGRIQNQAGYIGTTFGGRGVLVRGPDPGIFSAPRVVGQNPALPVLEIENNAGVLVGIPPDMRGSGGGKGGFVLEFELGEYLGQANGGNGGAGGSSIVSISRGVAYGVGGETIISGLDGATGGSFETHDAGSGGGGAPGTAMHLLDGSAVLFPILAGNIVALYGTSPITNGNADTQGKALASNPIDLKVSNARVAYVPDSRDPYPEFVNDEINDNDGSSLIVAAAYLRKATAPTTPIADDGQYDFTTKILTPPSITGGSADDWSATVPAGADPLYVTHGTFEIQGSTGIDSTVTWTAPIVLASDGAAGAPGDPGDPGDPGGDGNSVHVGQVFLRKASAPTTPIVDDGSYNFTTTTLTPPSIGGGSADDWSINVPSGADPLYVSAGTFEINGTTGIDSTVIWSAPVILASDGAPGATGSTGETGSPGYAQSWTYDDLDTTQLAAGPSRYAMLTLKTDTTSGDQNDFQATDGILINKADLAAAHDLEAYYQQIVVGDRITYYINENRWYLYEVDSLEASIGSGSTLAFNFGVTLKDFAEDSNSNISTAAGTPVLFQFSRAESGNFRDVKFKRSATVPATPTGDNPSGWTDNIPAGSDAIYQTTGLKTFAGILIGVWSTPIRIQGLVNRGAYSSGTAYLPDDMVLFAERSYICTLATTGNDPSGTNAGNTWWDLLAGKGDPGDPPTPFVETIVVPAGGTQNLRALANAHTPAYDGIADATVTFTVAPAVVIDGNAGGGHGIDTGVWPSGSATIILTLENDGIVRGGGGVGGKGGNRGNQNGSPGLDGGDAIFCQEDITIDNAPLGPGLIEASGGGGGGGGGMTTSGGEPINHGGGGGGGGFPNAGGGDGGDGDGGNDGVAGSVGTTSGGGAGGGGSSTAGDGGSGGNVNVNGAAGQDATGGQANALGGAGGTRGFAVRKNGHTVPVTGGTVTGQQG